MIVQIRDVIDPMANDGLRTICLAYKDYADGTPVDWDNEGEVLSGLTAVGIVGIQVLVHVPTVV